MARSPAWLPFAVAALISLPAPAAAAEVWTSQDGGYLLDARAFYKTMASGYRLAPGLVAGTGALADLAGRPEAALPEYGATSAHAARVWGTFVFGEHTELQAGWQAAGNLASNRAFAAGTDLLGAPAQDAASRRLVDFDPLLSTGERYQIQHNLDLLALKFGGERGDVTIGRQVFSWGSGRLWNPTDLLSPFAPTDIDREVRRGVDAVRVSIPLSLTAQADALWLPQKTLREQGAVARVRFNLAEFDVSPSVAKYVRDVVYGLDASGDLGSLGVHIEAAYTTALDTDERFLRGVAGLSAQPADSVFLTAEYYYNGWGTTRPEEYLDVLQSSRVARGEVFGAGRHYLGIVTSWQATGLLAVNGIVIANLTDPSAQLVPSVEYWAAQSILVRAGGYVPLGRGPDASGLQALTPLDAATGSEAFRRETGSLGLRSEYGASPLGLFAQVGFYFL